jgi:PKD repeat protein
MVSTFMRRAAVVVALTAAGGCTIHKAEAPPVSGPSTLALSLTMNAIPDSISQDGGSQSSIRILAIGADGRPKAAVPLRIDMRVNGSAQDYGTLSARTLVTNNDGIATVVYTAPPSPASGLFTGCPSSPLIGNCVEIIATATATDFSTAQPQSVQIRLVPPGVILPPPTTPSACFTMSPSAITANTTITFTAGTLSGGVCGPPSADITAFAWTFGDGGSASGRVVSHSFSAANTYNVTLTETNDRGISASVTQAITVGFATLPTPVFTVSPANPAVGQPVFFNASTSTAGLGHTISSYRWTFGDGTTGSGVMVSHAFTAAGVYNVQLTVTDEAGQSATSTGTPVTVGSGSGSPTALFTYSPPSPVPAGTSVTFDASPSTGTAAGSAPVMYQWQFECPSAGCTSANAVATTTQPRIAHPYNTAGTFTITLTVFDSAGRSGSTSRLITVF